MALGSVLSCISSLVQENEYRARAIRTGLNVHSGCRESDWDSRIPPLRATSWSPRRECQIPPATIFVRRDSPAAHGADRIENKFIDTDCAPQRVHA